MRCSARSGRSARNISETGGRPIRSERTRIRVFVCAAEAPDDVETLVKILQVRTAGDARFVFEFWHRPLAGEEVEFQVRKGLATSHLMLVLVSHQLLGDEARMEQVSAARSADDPAPMILPVLWEELLDDPANLKNGRLQGLELLDPVRDDGFLERNEKARRNYADEVIAAIRARLDEKTGEARDGWLEARAKAIEQAHREFAQDQALTDPRDRFGVIATDMDVDHVIPPRGVRASLRKSAGLGAAGGEEDSPETSGRAFDALDFLELWPPPPARPTISLCWVSMESARPRRARR